MFKKIIKFTKQLRVLVNEAIAFTDRFIEPGKNFAILRRINRSILQLPGTVGNQGKQLFIERWQRYLPGLRHLAIAKAARSEVVAFVDAEGDVDHGFAIGTNDISTTAICFGSSSVLIFVWLPTAYGNGKVWLRPATRGETLDR